MSKKPQNSGQRWTPEEIEKLRYMAAHDRPTGRIAYELGRSKIAVQAKASDLGFSLKPINRSPYNRHKPGT